VADFLWTHCSWTLQNAPRDEGKLRELLKVKQREYDKAMNREDIERLVSEIEMLRSLGVLEKRT
jgi:hypothetical protein